MELQGRSLRGDFLRFVIPSVISQWLFSLYAMVDAIFVSRGVSEVALGAINVASPFLSIMFSTSLIFAVGSSTLIAVHLGRGERREAEEVYTLDVAVSVVLGLAITAGALLFLDPFCRFLGGTEANIGYIRAYIRHLAPFAVFFGLGYAFEILVKVDGFPRYATGCIISGCLLNCLLDYLLVIRFPFGVEGAAVATAIGQVATAILAVWYLMNMRIIKPAPGDYTLRKSICGRMLMLGITSFLSQISLVAAMAAINNMLRKYGAMDAVFGQEPYAQIPMAVVGIVMKFFQIVISIVVGMAAGCIPIVGYNMGAEKKLRVRALFTKLLIAEALVGAVALVLAEGFPRQLIAVFGAANESSYYTDFAIKAFRTYLCMMILACINKACFIFLQAVGKALSSTLLSMFREVVFGVGFALLLPLFFGLDGVLYSMPVSDILTFIISAIIIEKTYRELNVEGVQKT